MQCLGKKTQFQNTLFLHRNDSQLNIIQACTLGNVQEWQEPWWQSRAALKSRIQSNLGKGHQADPCSLFPLPAAVPREKGWDCFWTAPAAKATCHLLSQGTVYFPFAALCFVFKQELKRTVPTLHKHPLGLMLITGASTSYCLFIPISSHLKELKALENYKKSLTMQLEINFYS